MEELLKEIMGNDFKEGMTKDDIQTFFKKQTLSTGDYVNKDKANATENNLKSQIETLKKELESKMTEDDKKAKASKETEDLIKELQKQLSESKANQSRMSAKSLLAEAKINANIGEDDADYEDFLSEISFEDGDKTNKISNYISKLVKSAYEQGKTAVTKDKLGKVGSFKGSGESSEDDEGSYGKKLAQSTKVENTNKIDFFERK